MAGLDQDEVRVLGSLLGKIESGVAAIGNDGFGLACGLDGGNGVRRRFNRH